MKDLYNKVRDRNIVLILACLVGIIVGWVLHTLFSCQVDNGKLIPMFSSLIGVVVGWGLNIISNYIANKPSLKFVFSGVKETDTDDDPSLRTKTSLSGEVLTVYNIGKRPVVLESIRLERNGKILVDCFLEDDQQIIEPYKTAEYQFMEQDRIALQTACNEDPFRKCDVVAYEINGNAISGEIDTTLFWLSAPRTNNVNRNEVC